MAVQVVLDPRSSRCSPSGQLPIERFARHAQFRRHVLPVAFFRQGVTFIEPGIQPLGHPGQRPDLRTHPRGLNRPGKHGRPGQYEVRILTQGHDEGCLGQDRQLRRLDHECIAMVMLGKGRSLGQHRARPRILQDQPGAMGRVALELHPAGAQHEDRFDLLSGAEHRLACQQV